MRFWTAPRFDRGDAIRPGAGASRPGGAIETQGGRVQTGGAAKGPVETMSSNVRSKNGNERRKFRARLRAMGAPCGICRGRLGPIHYDEPSDPAHPLSFVVDHVRPIARWREFGYDSIEAAARDWENLQAAHYICNQAKSDRVRGDAGRTVEAAVYMPDGEW